MFEALAGNTTTRLAPSPTVIAPARHMHAVPARIPTIAYHQRRYGREHQVTKAVGSATLLPAIPDTTRQELKAQLLDSLFGTERGLRASSELRAELNEIITQVSIDCSIFLFVGVNTVFCRMLQNARLLYYNILLELLQRQPRGNAMSRSVNSPREERDC